MHEIASRQLAALLQQVMSKGRRLHANRQRAVSTDDVVKFARARRGRTSRPSSRRGPPSPRGPRLDGDVALSGAKATVRLEAPAGTPPGIELPLRLGGEGGQVTTVKVKPGESLTVDAGFPVKTFTGEPARTVLADVR
ncbi:MAG: hypothetical protein AB1730_14520 [Myxococcota bacterium]